LLAYAAFLFVLGLFNGRSRTVLIIVLPLNRSNERLYFMQKHVYS